MHHWLCAWYLPINNEKSVVCLDVFLAEFIQISELIN